jgi:hypothetical protein
MPQAVNHRPLTSEDRVQSQASPWGICSARSDTALDLSPITSAFTRQHHSTNAPYSIYTSTTDPTYVVLATDGVV